MVLLLTLAALALWASIGALVVAQRDGYRRIPTRVYLPR
jgi:hypothetical protein